MSTEEITLNGSDTPAIEEIPAAEGNGRVLGRMNLPKELERAPVAWLSCTFPNCTGHKFREEEAILPNLKAIQAKLGRDDVSPEDLKGFVVCRYHANLLEDKGVRCYLLRKTLEFLERQAEEAKGLDAFLGGQAKAPPRRQETPAQPLKAREIPRGRDFASPAAQKPVGRRGQWQGKKKNRGWADRD